MAIGCPAYGSAAAAIVLEYVDGKRNYYDIYKAVKAENQAAGKIYYGTVAFADVIKELDGNVASGALSLKQNEKSSIDNIDLFAALHHYPCADEAACP
jgi:hypothetical protein